MILRRALVLSLLCLVGFSKDTIPLGKKEAAQVDKDASLLGKPKLGPQDEPTAPPAPEGATPYLASISVYGTTRLNESTLKDTLGKDFDTWIAKGMAGDDSAVELEEKLAQKVKAKFDFAYADWSVLQFFEPEKLAVHITLDVVEKEDVAKRMPFRENPKGQFKDPSGLLASWTDYENLALKLVEDGEITPDTEKCPAVHCPFGHRHAKLKKFEKIFSQGVKKNERALADILANSADADQRANAAYLLPYLNDPAKVVALMIPAVKDADSIVRNNALRVLGDIAERNKEVVIPTAPIVEALDFARTSDRSKAIYVAFMMAMSSQSVRDDLLKSAVPSLVKMLNGKQPDQRDFAHNILRKISGKEYAAADTTAWENWSKKQAKERGVTSNPGANPMTKP